MKMKFKKCNHLSYRIYPEADGNECYQCGWDKYNNRDDTKMYVFANKIIGHGRFKSWIKRSLIDDQRKKHISIWPKTCLSIIGTALNPLGYNFMLPSAGNINCNTNEYYVEQL